MPEISYETYRRMVEILESCQGHDGLECSSGEAVDSMLAIGGIEVRKPAAVRLHDALRELIRAADTMLDPTIKGDRRRHLRDAVARATTVLDTVRPDADEPRGVT